VRSVTLLASLQWRCHWNGFISYDDRSMRERLWILNNDNNNKNDACIATTEKTPSSKCREKFALGWDRVRYFSRVWANVKLANWLINKKYLTSVKGKTLLASEEALKFYDDAKNIASYQFSRWLVSSQPSLTCKSQVWYARKWKPSSHNGRSKCLTCTISHGDSWRIYAFIRKTKLVYWRHVLHPVRMYIYIYI